MINGVQRRAVQQDLASVDIVKSFYEVHHCTLRQAQLGLGDQMGKATSTILAPGHVTTC